MIIHPGLITDDLSIEALPRSELKCGIRQDGKGTLHFLNEILTLRGMKNKDLYSTVNIFYNRETATPIVSGQADAAARKRGVAAKFGLTFINLGWEALDFAVRRDVHFRKIFQKFLEQLQVQKILKQAKKSVGYDYGETGKLISGGNN